jgi:hypothetical protein
MEGNRPGDQALKAAFSLFIGIFQVVGTLSFLAAHSEVTLQ